MAIKELIVSQSIDSGNDAVVTWIPLVGKKFKAIKFHASLPANSYARLIWKYQGAEDLIWTAWAVSEMPIVKEYDENEADGILEIALFVKNGEATTQTMSAHVDIQYQD